MRLENLRLGVYYHLLYVLRRPLEELEFCSPTEILPRIRESTPERALTLHHYQLPAPRGKPRTLLTQRHLWAQHYLHVGDRIACCSGFGSGSGGRATHNALLDGILRDETLAKRLPTMVVVQVDRTPVAHHYLETYAYVDMDIGSNWDCDDAMRQRVTEAQLPFSRLSGGFLESDRVSLHTPHDEILVYHAQQHDALRHPPGAP